MAEDSNNNNDGVFVYTQGVVVPDNVVRVRFHPSVTVIPRRAFHKQQRLEDVELCEGLLEIGAQAFMYCTALTNIRFPTTLKHIRSQVFAGGVQIPQIRLPNGLESVGEYAFARGIFTNFRVPPLIVSTPNGMFSACGGLFSVEISESVANIRSLTFRSCHSLRNVAFPPNAEIPTEDHWESGSSFAHCTDLQLLFNYSGDRIINALKHRFDNLPIHKMIYYQSYNNMTVDQLNTATNMRSGQRRSLRSKLNPSGRQQDCLGMTPLHIMACSTVQNIGLYKVLVNKYPETLVTEDRFGALPLLYAVWGQAPDEIVQFLTDSYKSIYPNYQLDWTDMVKTLGIAGAPVEVIQNLLDLQEESFPNQLIDWDAVIERLSVIQSDLQYVSRRETFQFLVKCSFMERINDIGLKQWRDDVINKVMSPGFKMPYDVAERTWLDGIKSKLAEYEIEYQNLKEATTVLELVFWKKSINEAKLSDDGRGTRKRKFDEPGSRSQCRVNCGADIIIRNVLPYLVLSVGN